MMLTGKLRLLLGKLRARVASGDTIEAVMADYPLLTESEKKIILQEVQANEK